jgi:predicted RNase H-like HicB family nuclease
VKPQDRYLRFVRWQEADGMYVGYCPDLFPWGGVCHATTEDEAYRQLLDLVAGEVEDLQTGGKGLPPVNTRPMREAVPA